MREGAHRHRGTRGRHGRLIEDDQILALVTARIRVFAEPTRVRLMCLLDEIGAAVSADELADLMPTMTRQNVSAHLTVLHGSGLIDRVRSGKSVRYTMADWTALWVIEQIATSVADRLAEQRRRLVGDDEIDT